MRKCVSGHFRAAMLVVLMAVVVLVSPLVSREAHAWPAKFKTCSTSGCHITADPNATIATAFNGNLGTTGTVAPGGTFELDFKVDNISGNGVMGVAVLLPTGWTVSAVGTVNSPGISNWNTVWDASAGETFSNWGAFAAVDYAGSPDGYTLQFASTGWDSGNRNAASDDGLASDLDTLGGNGANQMGMDLIVQVPPGETPTNYTIQVLGAGHDGGKAYVVKAMTITVSGGGPVIPTLTTPTATVIGATTATLGANITADGGEAPSAHGVVWDTSTGPTRGTNEQNDGATVTGPFTQARVSLNAGTQIFYRGFATNSAGDAYSPEGSFYTEPATQAAGVNFTAVNANDMTINWTRGSGSEVIVLVHEGAAVDSDPVDGTYSGYTANTAFGGGTQIGTGNYVVYKGAATSVSVTGLTASTTYHFKVYEVAGTADDAVPDLGSNYLTTTPATASRATAGGNAAPTVTTPISDVTVAEDATDTVVNLLTSFDDVEDGSAGLTYTVFANDNVGVVTTAIAGGNLTLSYVADASGIANITIRATDGGGLTVDDTFIVTVNAVNDAPTFTSSAGLGATVGVPYTYNITTNDADNVGTDLTIIAVTKPAWLTLIDNNDGTATLSGTPLAGDVGGSPANDVTLRVSDLQPLNTDDSFTVTVGGAGCTPAAPTMYITPPTWTIREDSAREYTVTVTNNDTGSCGSSDVTLNGTVGDTNTGDFAGSSLAATTATLNPGESFETTLTVTSKLGATIGNFNDTTVNMSSFTGHAAAADVTVTTTVVKHTLMHNSLNIGSTKWGGWGVATKKYGEFKCSTCHGRGTDLNNGTDRNVKKVRGNIVTPDLTPWASSGTNTVNVRFTDTNDAPTGAGFGDDLRAVDTSSTNVCEACHSQNKFHNYDTTVAAQTATDHNNNTDCIGCHKHNDGFASGGCDSCHGEPPVNAGTLAVPSTNSTTAGAHALHSVDRMFDATRPCAICHDGSVGGGTTHKDSSVSLGFVDLFGAGTYTGGVYNGQTTVSYNATDGGTSFTNDNSKTCSAIYCHGSTLTGGTNTSPQWDDPTTADCGTCHAATAASPPTAGSHDQHANATKNNMPCADCHNGAVPADIPSGMTTHVDNLATISLDTATAYFSGSSTYDGTATVGDAYGSCDTVYCHSSVQIDGGGVGAPSYNSVQWGSGALTCASSCHGGEPATGAHNTHLTQTDRASVDCVTCHSDATDAATRPTANHVNQTINVDEGGYTSAGAPANGYGNCTTSVCHNDGTGTPVPTPAWGANTVCTSCHAQSPNTNAHQAHLTSSVQASIVCANCHAGALENSAKPTNNHNDGNNDADNTYTQTAQTYDGTFGTCSAASCHDDGTGGGSVPSPIWNATVSGATQCSECHDRQPTTGSHATHLAATAVVDGGCTDCHAGYTEGTTVNGTNHINTTVEPDGAELAGAGYTSGKAKGSAFETCGTTRCHGTKTVEMDAWGTDLSGEDQCTLCHGERVGGVATDAQKAPGGAGVDTNGDSAATDAQVGAHQAHLTAPSGISSPIACNVCHTVPGSVEAAGHLDATLGGMDVAELTWGGLANANTTTPTNCATTYCHDGSNFKNGWDGGTLAPVWNDTNFILGNSNDCDNCHGYPPPSGHPQPAPDCQSCHGAGAGDVNATNDGFTNSGATHVDGTVQAAGCTGCHGTDPNEYPPDAAYGSNRTTADGVGAHVTHVENTGSLMSKEAIGGETDTTGYWCAECHTTTRGASGHDTGPYPADVSFANAVEAKYGGTSTSFTAEGDSDPDAGVGGSCAVYCHGANMPNGDTGGSNQNPSWGDSLSGCGTCHGFPPNSGHTASTDCSTCHTHVDAADDGFTGAVNIGLHIDGTVQMQKSPLLCIDCHSTAAGGDAGVGADSPHIMADGSTWIGCEECHPDDANRHSSTAKTVTIPNNASVGINYSSHGGVFLGGTATINSPGSEAAICWGCHDGLGTPVSEWGVNTDTNSAGTNFDFGQLDQSDWTSAIWTSAQGLTAADDFWYKRGAIQSTHAASSGGVSGVDDVVDIRCSYCHDVHDTAGGTNNASGPYLRGSWMGNPYKEDGAPQSGMTFAQNHWGPVPRGSVNNTEYGGYHIDQNTTNTPASMGWDVNTSAGLCALCHGNADGVWDDSQVTVPNEVDQINKFGTASTDWVGTNGHSNAALGGSGDSAANIFLTSDRAPSGVDTLGAKPDMGYANHPGVGYGFRGTDGRSFQLTPGMDGQLSGNVTRPYGGGEYQWGATVDEGTTDPQYHQFSCSKCHNPHASRLPRLMITNCLDTKHNSWDQNAGDGGVNNGGTQNDENITLGSGTSPDSWNRTWSNVTSAQNCHRVAGSDDASPAGFGTGWNNVTPW